ncbi:type II toxin-antitoxin system RelE/ParE family toxin [Marinifilum sp. D737]|uniref:type II toxin-antitoxin system RelE/ParE family toxin n=1 Tax=Marinifilum sp. D737 TaxID=2969628 RepID=UPI0022739D17|nr:type II toxin-antitoxin system RelE/ParE family toxin [Marinifilum sp. D737]MCY1636584.1 type II toxin-antitoxin system RelE/ParE family toxin [Marinifilum sp. D737]
MIITFADNKLKKYANNKTLADRKMGPKRSQIYQRRLDDLAAAENFEDLQYLPGRYHQLNGDLKDKWACDLDHPYRLVFEPAEKPIPKDGDGKQMLVEIKSLEIIEVNNYHKEG